MAESEKPEAAKVMMAVVGQAMAQGMSKADALLVNDIARNAAMKASDSIRVAADVAPPHLRLLIRVVAWASIAEAASNAADEAARMAIFMATRG